MARHSSHILELARRGAEHRYKELMGEIETLVKHFPHLRSSGRGRGRRPEIDTSAEPAATIDRRRRRRRGKLSAAGRAAISAAQKKRWAALKRKKAGAK